MNRPALRGRFLSKTMMLAAVFMVASGFFYVPQAHASYSETLTSADVGTSFTVNWNLAAGATSSQKTWSQTLSSPLSALGTFTVDSLSSSQLVLGGTIDNTTVLNNTLTQAYLMSLEISSGPTATPSLITKGAVFNQVDSPENFPGGFKKLMPVSIPPIIAVEGKFKTAWPREAPTLLSWPWTEPSGAPPPSPSRILPSNSRPMKVPTNLGGAPSPRHPSRELSFFSQPLYS